MKHIMSTILSVQNLCVEFPIHDHKRTVKVAVKNLTLSAPL